MMISYRVFLESSHPETIPIGTEVYEHQCQTNTAKAIKYAELERERNIVKKTKFATTASQYGCLVEKYIDYSEV